MNFLHPWAIGFGAAALLIPLAIHFLTRPSPQKMSLSTIRFVQGAIKQRRKQSWLRDFLVLSLRALAIGCIAWAFARPLFIGQSVPHADSSAKVKRVVVLDVSQSMSASESGVDGFQAARVQAQRLLKPDRGLRANLILAGARADAVFDSPSANMKVLIDALANADSTPQRIDVQSAINLAARMLVNSEDSTARQELVVVSDFQRTNWATVDLSRLPEATNVTLESTAPQDTLGNVGILNVGFSEKPTAGKSSTVAVEIGNYSKSARTVKVQIEIGDSVLNFEEICRPNVKTTVTKTVLLPDSGWQTGWATLIENEDALAADDRIPLVVQVIESPNITLVSRQPPSRRPSSSYFIERALAPAEGHRNSDAMHLSRISPARFDLDNVSDSQLLVFDHPGKLQENQVKLLASLMQRGRGVLYVASEPVDATNLKRLYDELGNDLQAPVTMVPPRRGSKRESLSIASVVQKRKPFSVFGDGLSSAISDLKISGGLGSQRVAGSLDDDILATLSDQSILLFSSPAGLGTLCVLNADLEQSNLPRHPTFVPIMNELMETLLRFNTRIQTAYCGESLTRLLPSVVTTTEGIAVNDESGDKENLGEISSSGQGVLWKWKRLAGPTVFRLMQNEKDVFALASRIPPEESDLRSLNADVMVDRLGGGRNVSFNRVTKSKDQSDNSWIWFAVTAMLALVGEMIVLKCFRM